MIQFLLSYSCCSSLCLICSYTATSRYMAFSFFISLHSSFHCLATALLLFICKMTYIYFRLFILTLIRVFFKKFNIFYLSCPSYSSSCWLIAGPCSNDFGDFRLQAYSRTYIYICTSCYHFFLSFHNFYLNQKQYYFLSSLFFTLICTPRFYQCFYIFFIDPILIRVSLFPFSYIHLSIYSSIFHSLFFRIYIFFDFFTLTFMHIFITVANPLQTIHYFISYLRFYLCLVNMTLSQSFCFDTLRFLLSHQCPVPLALNYFRYIDLTWHFCLE